MTVKESSKFSEILNAKAHCVIHMQLVHFCTNKWNPEGWTEIWGNVANIFTYYLIRDIYLFTHPHVSPNLCPLSLYRKVQFQDKLI